ncbi:Gamma-tubulin complex component 2 [Striga hermonthica]|uniref:Gamma-tubulin complex component n=1 Tax=Striga hermonthica TaxID=68872 RepID=A0A9N7RAW8_STRHE|nr:Gamma-tubulin complex component 2 [Striga hermonthica]
MMMSASGLVESKGFSMEIFGPGVDKSIGCYHAAIQELIVIDDVLSALVGIEGRYISIRRVQGKVDSAIFQVDASMDLVLQESAKRIFPLCESYVLINQFVESRSEFKSVGSNHRYLECIKAAYDFASGELLNLIKEKYDLMGKLRSIKHYLLLDQGDFLVHFMDIAREELMKKPDEISAEKLQSLLDLALRSTAAVADPCHEDLTCCVDKTTLLKRLSTLKDLQMKQIVSSSNELEEPVSITGLETFSLSFKVRWPLSLVISRKALTKYQLIFRFLFHCKHVNRQLCAAWQLHQGLRRLDMQGIAISVSSLLCRNMLKFINSLLHYLTFEVLEPNWHVMHNRLQTAKSIDEVIQYHDFFLEKCLRECLLLSPVLLKV